MLRPDTELETFCCMKLSEPIEIAQETTLSDWTEQSELGKRRFASELAVPRGDEVPNGARFYRARPKN